MDKYSSASFSLKTIATFSSTLADEAEKYYQDESRKENYIVTREFKGSKIIIISKTGFYYKPDPEVLKHDEKRQKEKIEKDIKRYKNKMKLKKEMNQKGK